MFDRSTKASAQDSSGSLGPMADVLMRAVTIPGDVVLSQYYYFLIQVGSLDLLPYTMIPLDLNLLTCPLDLPT